MSTPAERLAAGQPIGGSIFTGFCWLGDCGHCSVGPFHRLCDCDCHKGGDR